MAIKVINTKKREIFDQFCSTINRFTNLIYVWNMRIFQNIRKNINWNTWAQKIEMKKSRKRQINQPLQVSLQVPGIYKERIDTELTAMKKGFNIEKLIRAIDIRRNSAPERDGIE